MSWRAKIFTRAALFSQRNNMKNANFLLNLLKTSTNFSNSSHFSFISLKVSKYFLKVIEISEDVLKLSLNWNNWKSSTLTSHFPLIRIKDNQNFHPHKAWCTLTFDTFSFILHFQLKTSHFNRFRVPSLLLTIAKTQHEKLFLASIVYVEKYFFQVQC